MVTNINSSNEVQCFFNLHYTLVKAQSIVDTSVNVICQDTTLESDFPITTHWEDLKKTILTWKSQIKSII